APPVRVVGGVVRGRWAGHMIRDDERGSQEVRVGLIPANARDRKARPTPEDAHDAAVVLKPRLREQLIRDRRDPDDQCPPSPDALLRPFGVEEERLTGASAP